MELEFPGFVLLLLVAVGLVAFGAGPRFTNPHLDRMAAAAAAHCAVAAPDERPPYFGAPTPRSDCGIH
jgi:hypothetical protein